MLHCRFQPPTFDMAMDQIRSLRASVSILLIQSMLWGTLMVPLALVDYELRKEYISEVLCINREKPDLECEGSCILTKKLNEAKDLQHPTNQQIQEGFLLSFFLEPHQDIGLEPSFAPETALGESGDGFHHYPSFLQEIFQPPELA